VFDRDLTLPAVRVTELAAIAAAKLVGRGDEKQADQAAVDAMRTALNTLDIDGTIVIGEGGARRGADALHRREGGPRRAPGGHRP
jgi:fructose-1,6-bisphosphatase/sedoheptulose 1,7-bisphosphatase-like protein